MKKPLNAFLISATIAGTSMVAYANPNRNDVYFEQISTIMQNNSIKELAQELGEEGLILRGISHISSLRCIGYANIYTMELIDLTNQKLCTQNIRIGACGGLDASFIITEPSYQKNVRCTDI